MKRLMLFVALFFAAAIEAPAQPIIDGTADALYGAALSVQNTRTQFGDNNLGDLIATANGGSEIDQVFGVITGGRLYVTVTGNLERNFNKLEIFIDSVLGGVNSIDGATLPEHVDGHCCGINTPGTGALQASGVNGLVFDADFNADYYLTFTHGEETAAAPEIGFWAMSAHYADLTQGTAGAVVAAGIQLGPQGLPNVLRLSGMDGTFADPPHTPSPDTPPTTDLIGPPLPGLSQGELIDKNYALDPAGGGCVDNSGAGCLAAELEFVLPIDTLNDPNNTRDHRNFENTIDLRMALNNINIEGVSGTGGPTFDLLPEDDPQNVLTGIEFSIPLSAIGNPAGSIKLTAYVNGTVHDFASNQFSGEGVLQSNFGSLPPDLQLEAAGDQFVIVPVVAGVAGDYNGNGTVDAADYVLWRAGGPLQNEVATPGMVTAEDYTEWRARFGNTAGSGGASGTDAVPEPASFALAMLGALLLLGVRRG